MQQHGHHWTATGFIEVTCVGFRVYPLEGEIPQIMGLYVSNIIISMVFGSETLMFGYVDA